MGSYGNPTFSPTKGLIYTSIRRKAKRIGPRESSTESEFTPFFTVLWLLAGGPS